MTSKLQHVFFLLVASILVLSQERNNKRIVCYYANWSAARPEPEVRFPPEKVETSLCTHVIYAFAKLDGNLIGPTDPLVDIDQGGYRRLTDLKQRNPELKTLISLGGWDAASKDFSALAADPDRRANFTKEAVKMLRSNNFDGIDLCWQYPGARDTGNRGEDKQNYASLIKDLWTEFEAESQRTGKPQLIISVVMSSVGDYIQDGYDIPTMNQFPEFINLIAYDYQFSDAPTVNHHAPLHPLRRDINDKINRELNVDFSVRKAITLGFLKEKLNMGIPTYGRTYNLEDPQLTDPGSPTIGGADINVSEYGANTYYNICREIVAEKWTIKRPNKTAMGPYAYKAHQWVCYDDPESAQLKGQYAGMIGLGGIMIWTIDDDDFGGGCHNETFPVIKAAKRAILNYKPPQLELPDKVTSPPITVRTSTTDMPAPDPEPKPPPYDRPPIRKNLSSGLSSTPSQMYPKFPQHLPGFSWLSLAITNSVFHQNISVVNNNWFS